MLVISGLVWQTQNRGFGPKKAARFGDIEPSRASNWEVIPSKVLTPDGFCTAAIATLSGTVKTSSS